MTDETLSLDGRSGRSIRAHLASPSFSFEIDFCFSYTSSIKHVELETLKYVSSGYGRYLTEFVLYTTHEPCAMCAGACVWARIGAVVYGVSQEDIAAYGRKRGTQEYKWRACLIPCRLVFEKGNHSIPVIGGFLRDECQKLFGYRAG